MKKFLLPIILIILIIFILFISNYLNFSKSDADLATELPTPNSNIETLENLENNEIEVPFQASFQIITNGITRNFSSKMYKNQSEFAYIPDDNSNIIIVNSADVTWKEFFDTLPFYLDEQCLITGDGDRLCNGEGGNLTFELNNKLDPNALSKIIQADDNLIIRYQ